MVRRSHQLSWRGVRPRSAVPDLGPSFTRVPKLLLARASSCLPSHSQLPVDTTRPRAGPLAACAALRILTREAQDQVGKPRSISGGVCLYLLNSLSSKK